MLFTLGLLVLLVTAGLWEFRRHQRNIDQIPVRVLVNGTRGKSSVTRLITGGLQGGRIRTLGKTTGTKPRVIYPDGHEVPIIRAGKANIIEQLKVFRRAVNLEVHALVTECMAVLPGNQAIMQRHLVRSNVGVITNVRADHLDEMGPTMEDVARSLSNTIPVGGVVFTSEHLYLPNLQAAAATRDAQLIPVLSDDITDEMMKGFTYLEHKDNVALALAVCAHLGVTRAEALNGMHLANPDPGVLRIFKVHYFERELEFVNAFAANDPDSYIVIWAMLESFFVANKKIIVIVNCREDRIQRTESLAELIAGRLRADHFILVGEFTLALYNRSVSFGLPAGKISDMGQQSAEEVFQKVVSMMDSSAIVIGIGNIVGFGEELIMHFTNRGKEIVY